MFSVFLSAVVVALLAGYYFLGNFLCERKEFCDISLYYNPDEVLEATRFKISVLKISICVKIGRLTNITDPAWALPW